MATVSIDGIDFSKSNVIFVNGLTLEMVKIKYNWLLNAKVKDAIVGENDRGIVWYMGDWYCGEWEDGTWYSGNFYDGVWKNGLFYSYKLDRFDVLNEKFFVKQTGNQYSIFHNGYWLNGTFYSGQFGLNSGETWTNYELYYTDENYPNFRKQSNIFGGSIQYDYKTLSTWINGFFQSGEFYDAIWNNGEHVDGTMQNSKWLNGNWYNGTFNGDTWYNGYWFNGNFIKGDWINGEFNQLKRDVISRFGNTLLNTDDNSAICNWYNGVWKGGDWFSGYIEDSNNNPTESKYNYLSIWHNGTWQNGTWYGGHFKLGTWKSGIWKNGVFGSLNSTEWTKPNKVYVPEYDGLTGFWTGSTILPDNTQVSDNVTSLNPDGELYEWKYMPQNIPNLTATTEYYSLSGVSLSITTDNYISVKILDDVFKNGDQIILSGFPIVTGTTPVDYNSTPGTPYTIMDTPQLIGGYYVVKTSRSYNNTGLPSPNLGFITSTKKNVIKFKQNVVQEFYENKFIDYCYKEYHKDFIDVTKINKNDIKVRVEYTLPSDTNNYSDLFNIKTVSNINYVNGKIYRTPVNYSGVVQTITYDSPNYAKTFNSYLTLDNNNFNYTGATIKNMYILYKKNTYNLSGDSSNKTYWNYDKTQVSNNGHIHYKIKVVREMSSINVPEYLSDMQKTLLVVSIDKKVFKNDKTWENNVIPDGTGNLIQPKCIIKNCYNAVNGTYNVLQVFDSPNYINIVTSADFVYQNNDYPYNNSTDECELGTILIETPNYPFVTFVGSIKPDLNTGDYIYVRQDNVNITYDQWDSYCWNHYDNTRMVTETGKTVDNKYYVKVDSKFNTEVNQLTPGKIVKLFGEYGQMGKDWMHSPMLKFFDFDFDIQDIDDSTYVNGIGVKYDTKAIFDNEFNSSYLYNATQLHLKNLSLSKFESNNKEYSIGYDHAYYTDLYRSNHGPYIVGEKWKNGLLFKNIDGSNVTNYLGTPNDLWGLEGLPEYYPITENFDPDKYNIKLLETATENVVITLNFFISNAISQRFNVSNVYFKLYYSNDSNRPKWLNGTWEKGVWYNGDFYNGNFLGGMWMNGNFHNGNISYGYR